VRRVVPLRLCILRRAAPLAINVHAKRVLVALEAEVLVHVLVKGKVVGVAVRDIISNVLLEIKHLLRLDAAVVERPPYELELGLLPLVPLDNGINGRYPVRLGAVVLALFARRLERL
jgi:hypothetical protein